jgi:hypothetical protein
MSNLFKDALTPIVVPIQQFRGTFLEGISNPIPFGWEKYSLARSGLAIPVFLPIISNSYIRIYNVRFLCVFVS